MGWWKRRRLKLKSDSNGNGCLEQRTKTTKALTFNDGGGKFICYCSYDHHAGTPLAPSICEQRQCSHYHKLYVIDGAGYFPEREKRPSVRMPQTGRPYSGNGHH